MRLKITFVLVSALLFILAGVCIAHNEPPKTSQEKLKTEQSRQKAKKAGIRKVLCRKYLYVKGERQEPGMKEYEANYDTNGCITDLTEYRNDTLTGRFMNYYNENFQLVTVINFSDGRNYTGVDRYEYNESGTIRQITEFSPSNKSVGRTEYLNENQRKIIRLIHYDSTDKVDYTLEYLYDQDPESGHCIAITRKDSKGVMTMKVGNLYDSNGNRTEKKIYKADNKLDYSFRYTYTTTGDFKEISRYAADGKLVTKETWSYNEEGLVTSVVTTNGDSELVSMLDFTYYMAVKK